MDEVGNALSDCPGFEHLLWFFTQCAPEAGPVDGSQIAEHYNLELSPFPAEAIAEWLTSLMNSQERPSEIVGWRTTRFGDQVVTYTGENGRVFDLTVRLDPRTGKFASTSATRSAGTVDVTSKPIADLTDDELERAYALFASAFRNADANYLTRRMKALTTAGLGWDGDELVAFSVLGTVHAELPFIGHHAWLDTGITIIHPSAHGRGLLSAVNSIALVEVPRVPGTFSVLRFATPVTLRNMFHYGPAVWPGTTIHEVAASLASPTPTQRAVGRAIAELGGAASYDDEHWVMRSADPPGETTTVARDLEPEYDQLFKHVNQAAGDALLGIYWFVEPPQAWWT